MADTAIRLNQATFTGLPLYVKIENAAGQVYNGTAMVAYVLANIGTYARAMTESPAGSGRFSFDFLALGLPADFYDWSICNCVGGLPIASNAAISDPQYGAFGDWWNGTTFGAVSAVADLPDPAPAGYGSTPPTGTTPVTQDTGGTNALTVQNASSQPIFGAVVSAYLASAYASNPAAAPVITDTTTDILGHWRLNLPSGSSYVLVFFYTGKVSGTATVTV